MICPSSEELLRAELGELVTHRTREIERHLAECSSCIEQRRGQHELFAELSATPRLPLSDSEFVEGVMGRRDESPRRSTPMILHPWRWGAGLSAVVALAATLAIVPRFAQREGTFVARGAKHQATNATFVEVLRVRANGLEPIRGTTLRTGDGIGVRFSNSNQEPRYLMVFALDSQREVHWIYPAYLEPTANPQAVVLAPRSSLQLLDEAVEPEAPAPGPLRVVTLVTTKPWTVKEVEARISGHLSDLAHLFPSAQVDDWGCTWLAK